jgi:hypothetical protein
MRPFRFPSLLTPLLLVLAPALTAQQRAAGPLRVCTAHGDPPSCVVVPTPAPAMRLEARAATVSRPGSQALSAPPEGGALRLAEPGGAYDDRLRVRQLVWGASTAGYLLRGTRSLSLPAGVAPARGVRMVAPELRTVWNSDLPFSLNEGTLWAGRGLGILARGGVHAAVGRMELIVAPELALQQNQAFQVIPYPGDDRDPHASPWYGTPVSADLPLRFGPDGFAQLGPGQSSLALHAGPAVLGVSSESQWWGPGIRNAIVMSTNAPGFPHLFVETGRPLRSRPGELEGKWILGRLTESPWFDDDPTNDHRSLSGLVLAFRPVAEPGLTLGFTRAVFAPLRGTGSLPAHLLDAFRDVGRPNDRPQSDTVTAPGPDALFSLFGRWVLPEAGAEVYVEWARQSRPASVRDFLVDPHHSQGFTVGGQWVRPLAAGRLARLQGELTNLERSATYRYRPAPSFYTSRPVPQGYTHLGRVIGAGIGPGAASAWLAGDLLGERARIGAFGGWIRWDEDAFWRIQTGTTLVDHDVTVYGGLRGAAAWRGAEFGLEATLAQRINYLYQNPSERLYDPAGVDIRNATLRLRVGPARRPR